MSVWVAGAVAVGSIGSAFIGSKSAGKAADAQTAAADRSAQVIRQNFLDTRQTLDPYVQAGVPAINRQKALLGLGGADAQREAMEAAYAGPGFEYQRDQVIGDVNRAAAAGGMRNSGNRLAALTDRLQGLYAQQEGNYFNRLGALGGIGLGAASAVGGVGQNAAAGQAQAIQQGGNAAAQGILGQGQSFASGLSDIAGAFGYAGANGAFSRNRAINGGGWNNYQIGGL